jgi:CBS-domain-containing membrane protein
MPSHAAMIEKPLKFSPDMEVEKAIKALQKSKQVAAGVVDEKGKLIGLFSLQVVLQSLLPVSVAMNDGITLDIPIRAAPGIAKRLKKINPLTVNEIMKRDKLNVVYPETPIWECVNRLLTHGSPVMVIDSSENTFLGMINDRSAMDELQRLQESEG